jgi:hypothetical protein
MPDIVGPVELPVSQRDTVSGSAVFLVDISPHDG